MTRKVLWNLASGSVRSVECCCSAAATQGWANCSSAARPAPRNKADSRLTFQLIEDGPKMPACGSDVSCPTEVRRASMCFRETRKLDASMASLDSGNRPPDPCPAKDRACEQRELE